MALLPVAHLTGSGKAMEPGARMLSGARVRGGGAEDDPLRRLKALTATLVASVISEITGAYWR
jgi:hypothetical protein